jgi:hypothetical protein
MNKYLIRFNQTRGQQGRGTLDHVWRVFENGQEFLVKHVRINVPCHDEKSDGGNWNFCCYGVMTLDYVLGIATIDSVEEDSKEKQQNN